MCIVLPVELKPEVLPANIARDMMHTLSAQPTRAHSRLQSQSLAPRATHRP